ncbi:MAG: hypothetical protein MUF06_13860 [Pirellulaceae bacterium]|jgi:hypothetical protein|nr:hypothetical protein [Pirellulaceae bacterium]
MSRHEPEPRDPQDRELTAAELTAANLTPAELTPELSAVEQQLAALAPRAARVDRDRLMFLAGAASEQPSVLPPRAGQRSHWLWPTATGVLAATSLGLAVLLALRDAREPQIVYLPAPTETRPAESPVSPKPAPREQVVATDEAADRRGDEGSPMPAAGVARSRTSVPRENYLQVRDVALRMGLDALAVPRSSGGAAAPEGSDLPTYRSLMQAAFGPVDASEPAASAPREFSQM